MRKIKVLDTVKLKKEINLGMANQPDIGDIGEVIKKKGFMCFLKVFGRDNSPSDSGLWKIRSHDIELVCPYCHAPFCYALREEDL